MQRAIPKYRHAVRSAPWPWIDFDTDDSSVEPPFPNALVSPTYWKLYPHNLFQNWTLDLQRSTLLSTQSYASPCLIYRADMTENGQFDKAALDRIVTVTTDTSSTDALWTELQRPPPDNVCVQTLFINNMTLPVLRILGTRYDITPFFFTTNSLLRHYREDPRRYREDPIGVYGDYITVTLPFIRAIQNPANRSGIVSSDCSPPRYLPILQDESEIIDVGTPLIISSIGCILFQDLLAIHVVRGSKFSTIISCHPFSNLKPTSVKHMGSFVEQTGNNAYWSKIFAEVRDPTLVFFIMFSYAIYAWEDALENLSRHINKLEANVPIIPHNKLIREIKRLQAYLACYRHLLQDFRIAVNFVAGTPNLTVTPEKTADQGWRVSEEITDHKVLVKVTRQKHETRAKIIRKEAYKLLSEIHSLEGQIQMQLDQVEKVTGMMIAEVRLGKPWLHAEVLDRHLTLTRITYLLHSFLPAIFMANVFGMNVKELKPDKGNNLAQFVVATTVLMILTIWIRVAALVWRNPFVPPGSGIVRRLAWPVIYPVERIGEALRGYRYALRNRSRNV